MVSFVQVSKQQKKFFSGNREDADKTKNTLNVSSRSARASPGHWHPFHPHSLFLSVLALKGLNTYWAMIQTSFQHFKLSEAHAGIIITSCFSQAPLNLWQLYFTRSVFSEPEGPSLTLWAPIKAAVTQTTQTQITTQSVPAWHWWQ